MFQFSNTAPVRSIEPFRALTPGAPPERLRPPVARNYFDLHADVDLRRAADWIANGFHPLVRDQPELAPYLAEGALMRLECGLRCFDAYRAHFGLAAA